MMKRPYYIPLTATPWKRTESYRELLPMSPALTGIIRCFWGSDKPYTTMESQTCATVVIPDTCVDILYQIDYTENTITSKFCGINDSCFTAYENQKAGHLVSVFGIRFYAWAACAFSEDSLKGTVNGCYDVQSRFQWLDKELRQQLFEKVSLEERSLLVENYLLKKALPPRQYHLIEHAIGQILLQNGTLNARQLAKECFISSRQMERLFHEYVGITPKKLCGLVRYQCLWNEIVRSPGFHILDAVSKFGYTDQSHLMREFKRYHTMNIQAAIMHARTLTYPPRHYPDTGMVSFMNH